MRRTDYTLEQAKEIIGYIVLLGSILGVTRQYFSLLLIGNGVWTLPFFSISYSIIDGLSFLIYFFIIVLGFIIIGSYKNAVSKYNWSQRFFPTLFFVILTAIITYFLIINYSPYTIFGLIFFIHFWKVLFIRPSYHKDLKLSIKFILQLFVFVGFLIGLLDLYKIFSPIDHSYIKNAPLIKEKLKDRQITALYINDTYIFVQSINNQEKTLLIQKIENLLDENKNAIILK